MKTYIVQVLNYTFTCFFPGQEIDVRLVQSSWLHSGSLVCPSCIELCQQQFLARGESCRSASSHSIRWGGGAAGKLLL